MIELLKRSDAPAWMFWVLLLAAAYNVLWGLSAIVFPEAAFRLAGMPAPRYPELWQCIGMIVGVYGIGYGIAAFDPARHWPIVLVGLLGKIFGPIGFAQALLSDRLPMAFGATIITNDLIWWVPFGLILVFAYRQRPGRSKSPDEQPGIGVSASSRNLASS